MTTTFEQEDRGAYYHGSAGGGYEYAWTQPGNIIRGNTFRHLGAFLELATHCRVDSNQLS